MEFLTPVMQGLLFGAGSTWLYIQFAGLARELKSISKKIDILQDQMNQYNKGATK